MTVTVLNGKVGAGDRVAYATREGNSAGIHVGTVVEVVIVNDGYENMVPAIKVRVEVESNRYGHSDLIRTVKTFRRVVKL